VPVLVHGTATEDKRVFASAVFAELGVLPATQVPRLAAGEVAFVPTEVLCPGLKRLLDVRRVVGLRNPAHSLVKLMNPCVGQAFIVGSYTHPEYASSMAATWALTGAHALLLRGTEGEPVADARRTPRMEIFQEGERTEVQPQQDGPLAQLPSLPAVDASSTAAYIRAVLNDSLPIPTPIALQVEHILRAIEHHDSPAHAHAL
ncbi:MAG: DNA-binding protein YbiB, partial [Hydrogenophaga sp.]|nr:DNA-binding protein YbiB [Hydrogenophaga sp.]